MIQQIAIIGAGTLGTRIALKAALNGFYVRVYDVQTSTFESSKFWMLKLLKHLGLPNELPSNLEFCGDLAQAVQSADLVSESVTEDLEIKRQVWAKISDLAPLHAILTTNTSYLLPSQLVDVIAFPERFCALHFHDVFYSTVVDIMPHASTSKKIQEQLMEFGRALDQSPVLIKKENTGYVFNFMLMALLGAAGKLKTKEIAEIEDIDRSWMVNFHMPMGPFGIIDSIGLDTAWHVTHTLPDAGSQAFAALLKTYIDAGKLGQKSGEGFYTYPNPRYKHEDFLI